MKLHELADNIEPIDENPGAYIEWGTPDDEGNFTPTIEWPESLRFHARRHVLYNNPDAEDPNAEVNVLAHRWASNPEFIVSVQAELVSLFPTGFSVWLNWGGEYDFDDLPVLLFSVWREAPFSGDTDDEVAFDALWPAIATLFNVTDPGTFNSPYLFSRF